MWQGFKAIHLHSAAVSWGRLPSPGEGRRAGSESGDRRECYYNIFRLSDAAPPAKRCALRGMRMCVVGALGNHVAIEEQGIFWNDPQIAQICADAKSQAGANICRKKRSCFAFFVPFAVKSADNLLKI